MYFHDPFDHKWDIRSYRLIGTISSVNEFVAMFQAYKELFVNGMFFIMREHILPQWEDENNKNGGCFSFKLNKSVINDQFFNICATILGETLGKSRKFSENVNGISISPKKNYHILRIWIKNSEFASSINYNIKPPKYSTLMYKNHSDD
jgi:translation initiation factor 4E